MEIIIAVCIGIALFALFSKRKGKQSMPYNPSHANTPQETAEQRKRREADEIVTVVLPTINDGKS